MAQSLTDVSLVRGAYNRGMGLRPRPTGTPWDILVIDSNRQDAQSLASLLEGQGCQVTVCSTAIKGAEACKGTLFDAVFSIISMRRMDAYELTYSLRDDDRTARVPVVLMTSNPADADAELCERLKIEHVIRKPVQLSAALAVLSDVLPYQHAEQEADDDAGLHRVHRRLEELGCEADYSPGGWVVGQLDVSSLRITLPTTGETVDQVTLCARGMQEIHIGEPALMMRMHAPDVFAAADRTELLAQVRRNWDAFLSEQQAALELIDSWGLSFRAEEDTGVVLQTEHGGEPVELSFQDRHTLVLQRHGNRTFSTKVINPALLVELPRKVRCTRAELEALIAEVLESRAHQLGALAELQVSGTPGVGVGQGDWGPREIDPNELTSAEDITRPGAEGPRELSANDFAVDARDDSASHTFTEEDFKTRLEPLPEESDSKQEQEFELEEGSILELDED